MKATAGIFNLGLIDSFTCKAGKHSDNHLLLLPATIPEREANSLGNSALALTCDEVGQ